MQGVRTLNTRNGKKQIAAIHHDSSTSTNSQKKPLKTLSPDPEPIADSVSIKATTWYISLFLVHNNNEGDISALKWMIYIWEVQGTEILIEVSHGVP